MVCTKEHMYIDWHLLHVRHEAAEDSAVIHVVHAASAINEIVSEDLRRRLCQQPTALRLPLLAFHSSYSYAGRVRERGIGIGSRAGGRRRRVKTRKLARGADSS